MFLLIVVCSSASNFEHRQTIRETWGNTTQFNYPYFERFHGGASNNSYLNINYKQWKKYAEVRAYFEDLDFERTIHYVKEKNLKGQKTCL